MGTIISRYGQTVEAPLIHIREGVVDVIDLDPTTATNLAHALAAASQSAAR